MLSVKTNISLFFPMQTRHKLQQHAVFPHHHWHQHWRFEDGEAALGEGLSLQLVRPLEEQHVSYSENACQMWGEPVQVSWTSNWLCYWEWHYNQIIIYFICSPSGWSWVRRTMSSHSSSEEAEMQCLSWQKTSRAAGRNCKSSFCRK